MIGIAETGSGKTLAFTIPALTHLSHRIKVRSKMRDSRVTEYLLLFLESFVLVGVKYRR